MVKRIMIAIVTVAVIAGGYLLLSQKQPEKEPGQVGKITLSISANEVATIVYVAEDQGYFDKNGLEVTLKEYKSGKTAADALLVGEADISTSADNVFVSNSFEHTDLRVMGTISIKQVKELVARKDKGIATTADLKGKKIGVTKKSGAEFQFGVFLTFNDLLLQDIEIVDLKPPEMSDAISNEHVDAVFVWDPFIYEIKKKQGNNAVILHKAEEFYFVLLTKKDWIDKHPDAAKRFIKSIVEAEDYIKNNSERVKKLVVNRFDYDSDYIDYSWPKQEFTVSLPQSMILALEDIARWRIQQGLTDATEVPTYLNYIYLDALDSINPEAVGIIGQVKK